MSIYPWCISPASVGPYHPFADDDVDCIDWQLDVFDLALDDPFRWLDDASLDLRDDVREAVLLYIFLCEVCHLRSLDGEYAFRPCFGCEHWCQLDQLMTTHWTGCQSRTRHLELLRP